MNSARLPRGLLCLAFATGVVGVGCGGAEQQEETPKVGQKAPPKPKAIPGEAEFNRGKQAGQKGDWKGAAQLFAQAAQLLSQNPDPQQRKNANIAVVDRGIALERGGDLSGAAAVYHEVLATDPTNPAAAVTLARVLVALKEVKQAKKVVDTALAANAENAPLLIMLAGVLRQTKDYKGAAAAARKVLLRDQKNVAAIKVLALVYADQGKLQLAETFFRNALKLDAKDVSVRVNLGLIAHKGGEHQKAILEFEEALKLDPKNGVALANIGAISLSFRDYNRAAKSYGQAVAAGMVNCTTASALGYALEGAQKGKEAVAQLGKAYRLCPKEHELLFAMGNICMEQLRDDDCALEHFEAYARSKKNLAKDHRVFKFIESIKEQKAMQEAGPETVEEPPPQEAPPAKETAAAGEEKPGEVPKSDATPPPQSRANGTPGGGDGEV